MDDAHDRKADFFLISIKAIYYKSNFNSTVIY